MSVMAFLPTSRVRNAVRPASGVTSEMLFAAIRSSMSLVRLASGETSAIAPLEAIRRRRDVKPDSGDRSETAWTLISRLARLDACSSPARSATDLPEHLKSDKPVKSPSVIVSPANLPSAVSMHPRNAASLIATASPAAASAGVADAKARTANAKTTCASLATVRCLRACPREPRRTGPSWFTAAWAACVVRDCPKTPSRASTGVASSTQA